MKKADFPPYDLVDRRAIADAREKTRRLERLYHLTLEHAWDGNKVLAGIVAKHGKPGTGMDPETRASLGRVLSVLLWGELAAWKISADLALAIDDVDAKMAATGQVFDEARHFTVLRDYVLMLEETSGEPVPPLGGLARKLLLDVLDASTLAKQLIGMQLLIETNAVVIFRRIAEAEICPVLTELLPYFERDESRHVGLGVMYLPRLIAKMSRAEAASTAAFQFRCLMMLIAGGFTLRSDFERVGLDTRMMADRTSSMQDDVVRQMVEAHGRDVLRGVLKTKATPLGRSVLQFIHPREGVEAQPAWHRAALVGLTTAFKAADRALA